MEFLSFAKQTQWCKQSVETRKQKQKKSGSSKLTLNWTHEFNHIKMHTEQFMNSSNSLTIGSISCHSHFLCCCHFGCLKFFVCHSFGSIRNARQIFSAVRTHHKLQFRRIHHNMRSILVEIYISFFLVFVYIHKLSFNLTHTGRTSGDCRAYNACSCLTR